MRRKKTNEIKKKLLKLYIKEKVIKEVVVVVIINIGISLNLYDDDDDDDIAVENFQKYTLIL